MPDSFPYDLLAKVEKTFDIRRYKGCAVLDIEAWATQITKRAIAKAYFEHADEDCVAIIEGILADPLRAMPSFGRLMGDRSCVSDAQVGDIWAEDFILSKLSGVSEAKEAIGIHHIQGRLRDEIIPPPEHANLLNSSAHSLRIKGQVYGEYRDHVLVRVELGATKRQIIEEFGTWLDSKYSEADAEIGLKDGPVRINKVFLRRCAEMRVLPYMDLILFGLMLGRKIPDDKIGNLIFPEQHLSNSKDVDTTDRVKKRTMPLASALLSSDGFAAMQLAASHHRRKKNARTKND